MANKSELLDQLKIDRSEPEASGVSTVTVVVIALMALIVGSGLGALFFGGDDGNEDAPPIPRSAAAPAEPDSGTTGAQETPKPAAARDERILNASGYITARRIATVSSQITGLITEVSVEEGMLVKEGQVLARLDDELARVDYDLAVARLASQRAFVDNVTANLAVESALTGHKVFSSLHTEESVSAVVRLTDMGVEPFLVASTVLCVVAQRLVRRVCPDCRDETRPTPEQLRFLGLNRADVDGVPFFVGRGCTTCDGAGYKGRRGIHEVLVPDDDFRDAILSRASSKDLRVLAAIRAHARHASS